MALTAVNALVGRKGRSCEIACSKGGFFGLKLCKVELGGVVNCLRRSAHQRGEEGRGSGATFGAEPEAAAAAQCKAGHHPRHNPLLLCVLNSSGSGRQQRVGWSAMVGEAKSLVKGLLALF